MNSKERVYAALRKEPVDRVPIFMWFHPDTAEKLGEILEIPPDKVKEAMGDDIRQVWVGNNHAMEGIIHTNDGEGHVDPWGIEWIKRGPFNQIANSPLEDASEDEVIRYKYPYHAIDEFLENMLPLMPLSDDYFLGCDVSPNVFEMCWRIRGMEQVIYDLGANSQLAKKMLDSAGYFSLELSKKACNRFQFDWLWVGDDIGGQQGMIISPEMWREMIGPSLKQIFNVGRKKGIYVAFHSCGAIRPIIPDLIEMGVDLLNPIQCNCPGMGPLDLKKEFGKDLSFMGGVDTQVLLPNESAYEVYRETEQLLKDMTFDGGGYILAASHAVPPETPIENIFAMYAAAGMTKEEICDRAADIRTTF